MTRAAIIAIAIVAFGHTGLASPRIAILEERVHAVSSRPALFVDVKSTQDTHAELVRGVVSTGLASTPELTVVVSEARRFHLDARRVDVTVVRLDDTDGVITAEIRAVISDDRGKLLSIVSSCAHVEPARRSGSEAARGLALRDAAESLSGRLRKQLVAR